jgi:hypothetical protein
MRYHWQPSIFSGFLAVCDFDAGMRRFESFLSGHSTMDGPPHAGDRR